MERQLQNRDQTERELKIELEKARAEADARKRRAKELEDLVEKGRKDRLPLQAEVKSLN